MLPIAVVSAGTMGSAVASRLINAGCTVYTDLDGRSAAAHQRARDAGMLIVPLETLVSKSQWILSIVPPREAFAFAHRIRGTIDTCGDLQSGSCVFVDCNAVNPEEVKQIADVFKGTSVKFIDAGIVGGPPRPGYDPTFYACSDVEGVLEEFAALSQYGLRVSLLAGPGTGVGDASVLKLCESVRDSFRRMIEVGLMTIVVPDHKERYYRALHNDAQWVAAYRSSPATADALMKELRVSQPDFMDRLIVDVPESIPKAYRFGYEMEGLSEFVGGGEANIFKGFASVFERVAQSLSGDKADIETLRRGVVKAQELRMMSSKN